MQRIAWGSQRSKDDHLITKIKLMFLNGSCNYQCMCEEGCFCGFCVLLILSANKFG